MLNRVRPGRAEEILQQAGSMDRLVAMGPPTSGPGPLQSRDGRFAIIQEVHRRSTRGGFEPPAHQFSPSRWDLPAAQGPGLDRRAVRNAGPQRQGRPHGRPHPEPGHSHSHPQQPREFFREALRYGATSALAWHNHPSGDPTPSREDIALTSRLRRQARAWGSPGGPHGSGQRPLAQLSGCGRMGPSTILTHNDRRFPHSRLGPPID